MRSSKFLAYLFVFLLTFNGIAAANSGTIPDKVPSGDGTVGPYCPDNNGYTIWVKSGGMQDKCLVLETAIVVVNDRIMFPMRELVEKLATVYGSYLVHVDWTADDRIAWAWSTGTMIGFPAGQNWMFWDGEVVKLDQGAALINGITRVPLRHVVEKAGGDVEWESLTKTIHIDTSKMFKYFHTPESSCALHGYHNYDTCPGQKFFAGSWVYNTWTHEFLRDVTRFGVMADSSRVGLINKMGIDHKGRSLEAEMDWVGASVDTFFQVINAIWIAGMLKNVLPNPGSLIRGVPGLPASSIELDGMFKEPTVNGSFEAFRNGWSVHTANYQARKTGEAYVKYETGYIFNEWFHNGVKFDWRRLASDGKQIFIEAKSDGGWYQRMLKTPGFLKDKWEEDLAAEALKQFNAVNGEYAIVEWHVESKPLQKAIEEILKRRVPQVFEYVHVILSP